MKNQPPGIPSEQMPGQAITPFSLNFWSQLEPARPGIAFSEANEAPRL